MAEPKRVTRLAALLVTALAVLGLAGNASAGLIVGVNDNAAIDPSELAWFYPTLAAEGLQWNTITLRWDDGAPTVVPDVTAVQAAIAAAALNGATVELDLYPLHSQIFTGGVGCAPSPDPQACGNTAEIEAFDAWVGEVAQTFPTVHEYVVMNECNQPLFVNPQWDTSGNNQSAEICGRALAGAYDELKSISSENMVWGVGLSPRGNDNPSAASDSSTSPVAFLQDLGTWFRSFVAATGRTTPLMDGLDFHPYPIPQSQPFSQGYQDANDASVSNLPRIYQAFYNGFNGTPQATIGQQAGGGLPVSLNEVGIQTSSVGQPGYTGSEVSATPDGGVLGATATEAYQASWYLEMLNLVACDPNVKVVNIFHLIDESDLAGWQSGLYYVDRAAKQSALTVHDWIASTGGGCQGAEHPWTPSGVPAAAVASAPPPSTSGPRVLVASDGRIRIFDAATHRLRRVLAPFGSSYTGPLVVAVADGNGTSEIATAEGVGGSPLVKLLNGKTGRELASVSPFPSSFHGGVSLAFAQLGGDPAADLVVGSGPGMPATVKLYSDPTSKAPGVLLPFGASFHGGVTVAAGSLGANGASDLVVGSGAGRPALVEVYPLTLAAPLETLEPFAAAFVGGVSVAVGRLAGGGGALIVGSGAGMLSVIKAYRGLTPSRLWSVDAFAPTFSGGVAVASGSVADTPAAIAGAGVGGGAEVRLLDLQTGSYLGSFLGDTGNDPLGVAGG